jgi:hypothetical protein
MNTYAAKDKKYIAIAKAATIKRFGPSGSLKKKNSILEQMMAAAPNISNEIFFDLKYIFAVLSGIGQSTLKSKATKNTLHFKVFPHIYLGVR